MLALADNPVTHWFSPLLGAILTCPPETKVTRL